MKPLEGISIIEAYGSDCPPALHLAGAFAGRILADLGARVSIAASDGRRLHSMEQSINGTRGLFTFLQAGKIVRPDADNPADTRGELAEAHAAIIDHSLLDDLNAEKLPGPSVVVSFFGRDMRQVPASEFTVLALSGILNLVGDPTREPLRLGGHQVAYAAGLSAATALLGLLCVDRPAEPASQEPVWISALETMIWTNWKSVVGVEIGGDGGKRQGDAAEWQVVRCSDGWIALVYQEADWQRLRSLIEDPRLDEPRFATGAGRRSNAAELARIAEDRFRSFTRAQLRSEFLARGLPCGPVWSLDEVVDDRHNVEREVFSMSASADGSTIPLITLPASWDGKRLQPGLIPAID